MHRFPVKEFLIKNIMIKKVISIVLLVIATSQFTFALGADVKSDTLFVDSQGYAIESEIPETNLTFSQKIDRAFTPVVDLLDVVLFWDPFTSLGLHDPIIYDEHGNPVLNSDGTEKRSKIPLVVSITT